MTRPEWIEATLISVVAIVCALAWPYFPIDFSVSQIILSFAVLLLAQSLLRDITILLRLRRERGSAPTRAASCMCLESTIGVIAVVIGISTAGLADFGEMSLGRTAFTFAIATTLIFGLAIKDWVITWRPWGLRREKDHINLLVRWRH